MQNAQLTILIPDIDAQKIPSLKTKLPALKLLLKRSDHKDLSINTYEKLACGLFKLEHTKELPIAAITGLADGLATHTGYWLRADPVQLQADLSAVYLIGNDFLTLTEHEANTFKQELDQLFKQDQLNFYTPASKRWYLQTSSPIQINTSILKTVTGKNISEYLPTGEQQNYWRKLLTEIQMLLYSCPTNQQRLQKNLPMVNGLWLWGAGQLPNVDNNHWQKIWSAEPLLKGLAKLVNINAEPPPKDALNIINQLVDSQHYLISLVPDNAINMEEWLTQLESTWLKPLVSALQKKQLESLALYLGSNKLLTINYKTIRYFWRR